MANKERVRITANKLHIVLKKGGLVRERYKPSQGINTSGYDISSEFKNYYVVGSSYGSYPLEQMKQIIESSGIKAEYRFPKGREGRMECARLIVPVFQDKPSNKPKQESVKPAVQTKKQANEVGMENAESTKQTVKQPTIKKLPANTQELNFPITHVSYTYTENGITSVGFKSVETQDGDDPLTIEDVMKDNDMEEIRELAEDVACVIYPSTFAAIDFILHLPITNSEKGFFETEQEQYTTMDSTRVCWDSSLKKILNQLDETNSSEFAYELLCEVGASRLANRYLKIPVNA